MKLTFLGANHEVTGSCTMLEAAGQRFLIDYGMEQGKNVYIEILFTGNIPRSVLLGTK